MSKFSTKLNRLLHWTSTHLARLQVMEIAVAVGEQTIPMLLDMVDVVRPEMSQLMGLVAMHMLSTWTPTHRMIAGQIWVQSISCSINVCIVSHVPLMRF